MKFYPANPNPSDLSYLPPVSTGYGAWEGSPEENPLPSLWLKHAETCLTYYHQPDLEALRITAAVALSQYLLSAPAIWIFILGESSTGKTSLFLEPLEKLDHARILSSITPKSFLSGQGTGQNGLLRRQGPSGTWLFKEFGTLLQKRIEDRNSIMASLREIWDGRIYNETGADAGRVAWEGKITCIAACTYAIEGYWAVSREIGERFLTLRLRRPNGRNAQLAARAQQGRNELIKDQLLEGATNWIKRAFSEWRKDSPNLTRFKNPARPSVMLPSDLQNPPPHIDNLIYAHSHLLATLRTTVTRDVYNKRAITDISRPELPARISSSLWLVALSHARLFGRRNPETPDYAAAFRLCYDSLPSRRRLLLESVPKIAGSRIKLHDLRAKVNLPDATFSETLEDLTEIGVLRQLFDSKGMQNTVEISEEHISGLQAIDSSIVLVPEKVLKMPAR